MENYLTSVVFRWLRHEKSGKRFSHTHLGVWVLVCGGGGGGRGHMAYEISHFPCCRSPLPDLPPKVFGLNFQDTVLFVKLMLLWVPPLTVSNS